MSKVVNLIRQDDLPNALWEICSILEHDAGCWKHIMERSDPTSYEGVFAQSRMTALQKDVDTIYEILMDKQREQQREEQRNPLGTPDEHPANRYDYTKRVHRKGHGWKANHEGNV